MAGVGPRTSCRRGTPVGWSTFSWYEWEWMLTLMGFASVMFWCCFFVVFIPWWSGEMSDTHLVLRNRSFSVISSLHTSRGTRVYLEYVWRVNIKDMFASSTQSVLRKGSSSRFVRSRNVLSDRNGQVFWPSFYGMEPQLVNSLKQT